MTTDDAPVTDTHDPRLANALDALRKGAPTPPALDTIRARAEHRRATSLPSREVSIARVATLVAALIFVVLTIKPAVRGDLLTEGIDSIVLRRMSIATLLPAGVLGWAFVLLRQRRLGAQLLTRAIWWSNLIVGVLIAANFSTASDRWLGAFVGLACAVPLFVLGSKGLDARDPDHPFSPVRFRGLLLLALVMAFADAQTLLFSAVMQLRIGMSGWSILGTVEYAGPTIFSASLMTLTVWGIYRLRTWALLLNLVANFAIAYFALEGTLNLSPSVGVTLAATAAIQAFIPVPILATALGDRDAGQSLLGSRAPKLMRTTFVILSLGGIAAAAGLHSDDGWVTGPARAFFRGSAVAKGTAQLQPGVDLSGQSLDGPTWYELDGTGARLRGTSMGGGNLRGVVLANIDGRGADFRWSKLVHADFRGADLRGALFPNIPSDMRDTNFTNATCPDGHLSLSARGCDTHLGQLATPLRAGNYATPECWAGPDVSPAAWADGYVTFLGATWLQQQDGSFTSPVGSFRLSDKGQPIELKAKDCSHRKFELLAGEPK